MKFEQTPTVIGLIDFEFPTQGSVEIDVTAFYHSKVGVILPNGQMLISTVESLYVQIETGLAFFWTAHKDKRYIRRKFKSYR